MNFQVLCEQINISPNISDFVLLDDWDNFWFGIKQLLKYTQVPTMLTFTGKDLGPTVS